MDFLNEVIKTRRTVRRFKDQEVSDKMLDQLIEAVRWAPSWANTQCWEIVVVKDLELKEGLASTLSDKNPAIPAVAKAPLTLAVCARLGLSGYHKGQPMTKFGDWFMFDLGLATQNLCLTAHSMGLGSVIVGAFDHEEAGRLLKMPEGYEVVVLVPIGYPAQKPKPPKRKDSREFVHTDGF